MAKPTYGTKLIAVIAIAIIGAAAGFGYVKQSSVLGESEAKSTKISGDVLTPKPTDIIIGDVNALVTVVEYMSMSCNHCAHFHRDVVPTIKKEFIDTGKAKLVLRHFPLNEPAMKGAIMVECAGQNGLDRLNFVKTLFDMQEKWAFSEGFLKDLKQITSIGGIDSAAFDTCNTDKTLEDRILATRQEAQDKLQIDGTPAFFVNGVKYTGPRTIDGMRTAIAEAQKAQK